MKTTIAIIALLLPLAALAGTSTAPAQLLDASSSHGARLESLSAGKPGFSAWTGREFGRELAQTQMCVCFRHGKGECIEIGTCQSAGGACGGSC